MNRTHFIGYASLLIILFVAQFLFISPAGEFALNDNWVHTDSIRTWTKTGEFTIAPFAGPTFYVPILYGSTLTKIFGFSFSTLRISTLVLALSTLLFFYSLLTKITHKPIWAFIGVLTLWFNPIFYNLSFTFMTDIPALFFFMAGLYLYWFGFKRGDGRLLFWGSIFAILGAYTRQTTILLFVAAGIYALINPKKIDVPTILGAFGIPLVLASAAYIYLLTYNLLPQGTSLHIVGSGSDVAKHVLWWLFFSFMYLGFKIFIKVIIVINS